MGPMKYAKIEFETTDWVEDIKSPFTEELVVENDGSTLQPVGNLTAVAGGFVPAEDSKLVLDRPSGIEATRRDLRCVVVGVERMSTPLESQKYYVLIVSPVQAKESSNDYERVGISTLTRKEMKLEDPGILVRIV